MTLGRVMVDMIQSGHQYPSLYLDSYSLLAPSRRDISGSFCLNWETQRARLIQETGVDNKMNQESYYNDFGYMHIYLHPDNFTR